MPKDSLQDLKERKKRCGEFFLKAFSKGRRCAGTTAALFDEGLLLFDHLLCSCGVQPFFPQCHGSVESSFLCRLSSENSRSYTTRLSSLLSGGPKTNHHTTNQLQTAKMYAFRKPPSKGHQRKSSENDSIKGHRIIFQLRRPHHQHDLSKKLWLRNLKPASTTLRLLPLNPSLKPFSNLQN